MRALDARATHERYRPRYSDPGIEILLGGDLQEKEWLAKYKPVPRFY